MISGAERFGAYALPATRSKIKGPAGKVIRALNPLGRRESMWISAKVENGFHRTGGRRSGYSEARLANEIE